jgi:hypothetical protein
MKNSPSHKIAVIIAKTVTYAKQAALPVLALSLFAATIEAGYRYSLPESHPAYLGLAVSLFANTVTLTLAALRRFTSK